MFGYAHTAIMFGLTYALILNVSCQLKATQHKFTLFPDSSMNFAFLAETSTSPLRMFRDKRKFLMKTEQLSNRENRFPTMNT